MEGIEVNSDSIRDGRLLTACAADRQPNDPMGENISPEISWDDVNGAEYYAVLMIDRSADDWVHMYASDEWTTELSEGELESDSYVGPYPPDGTDDHEYEIWVFALEEDPGDIELEMDAPGDFDEIRDRIARYGIIAEGSVTALFAHGDEIS